MLQPISSFSFIQHIERRLIFTVRLTYICNPNSVDLSTTGLEQAMHPIEDAVESLSCAVAKNVTLVPPWRTELSS